MSKKKDELAIIRAGADRMIAAMQADPEKARTFIRTIMGPARRTLEGQEYADVSLLLRMTEPFSSSNNQHTATDEYKLGGKLYHVTYFPGLHEPEIAEIEDDI